MVTPILPTSEFLEAKIISVPVTAQ